MDIGQQDSPPESVQFNALALKVIVKTVLKSVLWFGLAWFVTVVIPGAVWPWYMAFAFVAVGLVFSLLMLAGAFAARRLELRSLGQSDEHDS